MKCSLQACARPASDKTNTNPVFRPSPETAGRKKALGDSMMNNTPPQYYIFFWRAQIFVLICNCAPSLSSLLVFGHVVGHAHPSIRYFLPSRPYFPDIRCPLRNTSIRLLNFKSPGQFRRNGTLIFCRCARVNLVSDMANPEMKCD